MNGLQSIWFPGPKWHMAQIWPVKIWNILRQCSSFWHPNFAIAWLMIPKSPSHFVTLSMGRSWLATGISLQAIVKSLIRFLNVNKSLVGIFSRSVAFSFVSPWWSGRSWESDVIRIAFVWPLSIVTERRRTYHYWKKNTVYLLIFFPFFQGLFFCGSFWSPDPQSTRIFSIVVTKLSSSPRNSTELHCVSIKVLGQICFPIATNYYLVSLFLNGYLLNCSKLVMTP